MDSLKHLIMPSVITVISLFVLFLLREVGFRVLQRWAKKTETTVDDLIIRTLKTPTIFWAAAMALYIGVAFSRVPERYTNYINKIIYVAVVLSVTIVFTSLSGKVFKFYVQRAKSPVPATGLATATIKGVILVTGLLLIMSGLGISITPIITALGVGGLAVALALQDTLANMFAGLHIMLERTIRVGDFIKLESGEEGYVEDITWRTTRIRMLPNNMVLIPNSKLAQSIITNYYLPIKRMSLLIRVGVSYDADPEHVEKVLLDVAKSAVGEIPGLVGEPEPFVRFIPGFGDSSLDFTLICQVKEFVDQYLVQHELRKRIFKRFKEEGIEIPFPHRTVYLREEKDWQK